MNKAILMAASLCLSSGAIAAGGGVPLESANVDIQNTASLQRGAKLFANYCMGCHSLNYMRYSRLATDLELTEEQVTENLIFDRDKKIGDLMTIAMNQDDASEWLGAVPPDLSVVARSRGADWIYSFLKSYYVDPNRPTGWNNYVFENTSMPHVLWDLQGINVMPEHGDDEEGDSHAGLPEFASVQAGSMSPEEYDETVRDLVNYIQYVGEPAALKRASMGVWVLLYISVFTFIAYLLKKEFWRDIH